MTSLPSAPPPGLTFWPLQWAYLVSAFQSITTTQQSQAADLASIHSTLELIMTQDADLTAAVQALTEQTHAITTALAALKTAADAEIADVQALLTLLASGPGTDPAVASAIIDVEASTAELQAATETATAETADLSADDSSVPPA